MTKPIRKITSIILAALILAINLSSCKSTVKSNDEKQSGNVPELGLPIVKEPLTLTYWTALNGKAVNVLKNYSEMGCYIELEKRTGIHIEFQHPQAAQVKEQLYLMLASRDLPDIIEYDWSSFTGGSVKAINDEVIIKLNDLIDKNAVNLKKMMAAHPEWKKEVVLDDGTFCYFPFIRGDDFLRVFRGFLIRKDWLDNINLKMPKTIDEWHTVLKAFKEKDPNGNAKNDEVPFAQYVGGFGGFSNFMYSYGIVFDDNGFYVDNGKVKFSFIQPAYKDFLTTMQRWYKEGLIDPKFPSVNRKMFDAMITSNTVGAMAGGPAMGFLGGYMEAMKNTNPDFALEGVEFPIGTAGKSYGWADKWANGSGAAITTANKHQIETIRWLDYAYSEEGRLLMNFGPEGSTYNLKDGKVIFLDSATKAQEGFEAALARYGRGTYGGPFIQHRAYLDQGLSFFPQQSQAVERWKLSDTSLLMPAVSPIAEESDRIGSIMSEVNTYVSDMRNKFIMGQVPIDEFDSFVSNIKKMNIDEAIKMEQAAYDRFQKR